MLVINPSHFRETLVNVVVGILLSPFPSFMFIARKALAHISLPEFIRLWHDYLTPPQRNKFKYYLSAAICIKDEGSYMQEWVEYHLLQGVEHFYIYNNNGTDNTREILDPYIQKGLITWIDFPGKSMQKVIYNDAIQKFKNETRWMTFIDADEFVFPMKKNMTFAKFLKNYEEFSQLLMHWCIFGSSGHIKRTKGLVIERFKMHQKGALRTPKSVFNPRAVIFADVHTSLVFGKTVNENKKVFRRQKSSCPVASQIRVNHYVIKSWEEYQNKRKRGDVLYSGSHLNDGYFQYFDKMDKVDDGYDQMKKIAASLKKRIKARSKEV